MTGSVWPGCLAPEDARLHIAFSMQRGRSYTANDVSTLTGVPLNQTRKVLIELCRRGFMVKSRVEATNVYEVVKANAGGGTALVGGSTK